MRGRLRRTLDILLHVEDSPHRTALAFGIGVFIAFFPILGIHTGLALAIAFLFRLGRVPILLGAYINNPWTLAPLFMAGTVLGCLVLGVPPPDLARADWGGWAGDTLLETLRPYIWPFLLGNTVLGILGGVAGYLALRLVLERRRQATAS